MRESAEYVTTHDAACQALHRHGVLLYCMRRQFEVAADVGLLPGYLPGIVPIYRFLHSTYPSHPPYHFVPSLIDWGSSPRQTCPFGLI